MSALEFLAKGAKKLEASEGDPAIALAMVHDLQMELCDVLESIADLLPDRHDRRLCAELSRALVPMIIRLHRFEEDVLFSTALHRSSAAESVSRVIKRFRGEHSEDEFRMEELSELLCELGRERQPENPEAAGYLLRSVFEAVRRHCAYEREYLSSLLEDL
ncbi:MAG: hypothetical protein MnENMB40S_23440 [Rhizobiaceae bacterium MnEN-MB40S]|nr:MAG: hypothetical protein MnENMB40S_23440 [Rhizobiaceae bacterium MnEN-MB40S]